MTTPTRLKYYGVWIPTSSTTTDTSCVTTELKTVTGLLNRNPGSRFIVASTESEAQALIQDETTKMEDDTEIGGPDINALLTPQGSPPRKQRRRKRLSLPASNLMSQIVQSPQPPPMKPLKQVLAADGDKSKFPSPRPQELTALAREIDRGISVAALSNKVNTNPRLLATDCDLPTTVQEGCHYNALHMAAKSNNSEAIAFILNTVGSLNYFRLLGNSDEDLSIIRARLIHLTDGYLNTPDKMARETPLHFASKFLAVEAVEVLLSHPLTDRNVHNFSQLLPSEIIGSRNQHDPQFKEKKKAIKDLFVERVVVPLWKDSIGGAATSAVVGEKATFRQLGDKIPPPLLKHFPDFDVTSLGPCSQSVLPKQQSSLRIFACDSSWSICAFAGPMTLEQASQLTAALKMTSGMKLRPTGSSVTSPFSPGPTSPFSPLRSATPETTIQSPLSPTLSHTSLRLTDPEKGLERIAATFCKVLDVPWAEAFWPFGRNFYYGNLASPEGLSVLNDHLALSLALVKIQEQDEETGMDLEDVYDELASNQSNFILCREFDWIRNNNYMNCTEFDNLQLNSSDGYPTPRKPSECRNPECKVEGRFCTCEGVAPPLPASIFVPRRLLPSLSSSSVSAISNSNLQGSRKETDLLHNHRRRQDSFDTSVESAVSSTLDQEDEDDFELEESYESAEDSDDDDDDEFFECRDKPFFFSGPIPTKQDFQLYAALKDNEENVSVKSYPAVFQWINIMKALGGKPGKHTRAINPGGAVSKLKPSASNEDLLSSTPKTREPSSSSSSSIPRKLAL